MAACQFAYPPSGKTNVSRSPVGRLRRLPLAFLRLWGFYLALLAKPDRFVLHEAEGPKKLQEPTRAEMPNARNRYNRSRFLSWAMGSRMRGDAPKSVGLFPRSAALKTVCGDPPTRSRLFVGFVLACTSVCTSVGKAAQNTPRFTEHIAPILARRCLECHDSATREGELDLSRPEGLLAAGEGIVIAGNADASTLWQRVVRDEMPPEHALPNSEKESLKAWIDGGASWEGGPIDPFRFSSDARAGYDWWSLQPLADSVPLPPVGPSGPHPIDRFVDAQLHHVGLTAAGRADARTLVRRLYNDLIGLPPNYEVVVGFESDPSDAAWATMVDRLLDSPEFGERWAQQWLDLARFGESDGFEYNQPREHAWPYRDWLIRAFNQDLPYDQFAQLQLAGDLIEGPTADGLAAIGFLVAGVHNPVIGQSEAMRAHARHAELEEMAATVSQAFLGLTLHCARCHDHKFDPISTTDYYRFIASLDGVQHGTRVSETLPTEETRAIEGKRVAIRQALIDEQLNRGVIRSLSGNALVSRHLYAINTLDQTYSLRLLVSPTVWADQSQATGSDDGVLVRLLREDGSVAHRFVAQPGSWADAGSQSTFAPFDFEYRGDGTGNLRIRIESSTHENRFGGAIDRLSIAEADHKSILDETFDDLEGRDHRGTQANTSATVYYGMTSSRWTHAGINAIHAVELAAGGNAVQLYGGTLDTSIEASSETELHLQRELSALPPPPTGAPIYTVVPATPGAMHVMRRGDPMQPGNQVLPGGPRAIVGPSPDWTQAFDASDGDRRLGLARWLTDPNNGPFHRTAVNRVWHWLLGRGLVETPSDLGFQGGRPSHPELLEWLAYDFRESRLSIKKLIRQIVLSETYRRSSLTDEPLQRSGEAVDREGTWLWRRQPKRIEAEVLRDSMLAITDTLSPERYGPGYRDVAIETVGAAHYYRALEQPDPACDRRTIYRWRPRGDRSSLLEAFDCPDPSAATPERAVTTTPTQALSLWNHALVLRMSRQLAAKVAREAGDDVSQQVRSAWRSVMLREPTSDELSEAMILANEFGLTSVCRVLFNAAETVTID